MFLFGEHGVTVLRGAQVATLLNGSRDAAALVRARPGEMDAEQVTGLLRQLAEAGLIAFGGSGASPEDPASAWWDACGIDADVRARPGRVGLTTVGPPPDTAPFEAAHAAAGNEVVLTRRPVPDAVDLGVVLSTDYLDPELAAVDAAYRAAGRPWLLAKVDGAIVWLGPVFGPGAGGCWHCLSHRLRSHRWAEAVVQESLGRRGPAPRPASSVPPDLSWAAPKPALAQALAMVVAVVETAGKRVLTPSVRGVVFAELAARAGRRPQLGHDWTASVVSGPAPAQRSAARLALFTAVAPLQVDDTAVEAFRRDHRRRNAITRSGADSDAAGDAALVALTAWAGLTAARQATVRAVRRARGEKTAA